MSARVCVLSPNAAHPSFHRIRNITYQTIVYTGCGYEVRTFGINSIRRERAELFATACRRCFPEVARLTGDCELDCQDFCAYPGKFSECAMP